MKCLFLLCILVFVLFFFIQIDFTAAISSFTAVDYAQAQQVGQGALASGQAQASDTQGAAKIYNIVKRSDGWYDVTWSTLQRERGVYGGGEASTPLCYGGTVVYAGSTSRCCYGGGATSQTGESGAYTECSPASRSQSGYTPPGATTTTIIGPPPNLQVSITYIEYIQGNITGKHMMIYVS